jgi:hypothetical protein
MRTVYEVMARTPDIIRRLFKKSDMSKRGVKTCILISMSVDPFTSEPRHEHSDCDMLHDEIGCVNQGLVPVSFRTGHDSVI